MSEAFDLTTYYAKRIIGDTGAASENNALLQTGPNITGDTWILHRDNRTSKKYGIKYAYDSNGNDKIEYYGKGTSDNATAWIQLNTGDASFYDLYANSAEIAKNIQITTTGYGLYLTDSASSNYAGIYDNGANLWIGATSSSGQHHKGNLYLSAGHNGTAGNKSIYISIPANGGSSTSHTAYALVYKDAAGSATQPIYVDSDGKTIACNDYTTLFTKLSWTAGNSSGPVLDVTIGGTNKTATIPSASATASGIVTTGSQTFSGIKKFYREGTTEQNYAAGIQFENKDTTTGQTQTGGKTYIYAYNTHAAEDNGMNMVIRPGGNLFVGGGESAGNLYATLTTSTAENLYLTADSTMYLEANANTIANRIGIAISTSGHILPQKAEAANNNAQNIGASDNKFANVYATTFRGALNGNADTATALTSNAGGTEQPIYFTGGKPSATSYALKATVNDSTAGYMAYYSAARAVSGTSNIRATSNGTLSIFPTGGSYRDGIRIHARSSDNTWAAIVLCGSDNTGDSGTSANTWFIGANGGDLYFGQNGTGSSGNYLRCVSGTWAWNGTASGSISGNAATATQVKVTNLAFPSSGSQIYYPTLAGSTTTGNQDIKDSAHLYLYENTTTSYLNIGSGSSSGGITIHNANGKYTDIVSSAFSANRVLTLPDATGTICLTNGTGASGTWGISISGSAAKLGTANVGGANRPIYLNAGTATAVSWYHNSCTITGGNTANYPWHRFAYCTTGTGNYTDKSVIVILHGRFDGGQYGMVKLSMRTNAAGAAKSTSAVWIYRKGFAVDDIKISAPAQTTGTDETISAYIRCSTYPRRIAYILEGSNLGWALLSSNEPSDTTTSDKKGGIEINASISGNNATDGTTVSYANSAGSCTGNAVTATNADKVDNYHAADLWRKDGGIWNGGANIACTPTANNQEYSFDLGNAYTGTYWHVWSGKNSASILQCYNDNRHVIIPVHLAVGGYDNTSYALSTNSFICNSWIRTKGNTGWYNEDYGGGWYMTDSTWIRSYNNKSVYVNTGDLRCDGSTWGGKCRMVDNWLGFYSGNGGGTRYGYIQCNVDRMYFRKENSTANLTYYFDFGNTVQAPTFRAGNDNATYSSDRCKVYAANGTVGIHSSTNRGLYEFTDSKWIIYLQHSDDTVRSGYKIYGAVWNDFAEMREGDITEGGYAVYDDGHGHMKLCTERLQPGARLTSDTFGIVVGHTETAKTPIGVAGRVLVYPAQDRINYKVGDAVCAAPGGKVDLMTREEIMMYPERILGIVSEIPDYEVWNQRYKVEEEKEYTETNIQVNGRIWIYVR